MATLQLPQRQLQLEPLKGLTEKEQALRAACLRDMVTFGEAFYPGWVASRFHEFLGKKLEDCLRRKIRRLAVSVPPQHGKSRESSVIFPAWALTKFPTLRIFQAGWNGDLSKGFTREARDLVNSPRYRQLFPDLVSDEVDRQGYWLTKLLGYYYSTAIGGGTGMPADIMLVDDPHKDRTEANSPSHRQRVWDWVTSTALTRLAPDGVLAVIHTRWNDDDLIGRLTKGERVKELEAAGFGDLAFEVVRLEAICENPLTDPLGRQMGEALWPEVRPLSFLNAQRIEMTVEEFDALYQQRPRKPGGDQVDTGLIKIIEPGDVPEGLKQVRGWDLALTVAQESDWSCGARGGMHKYTSEAGQKVEDFYLTHMHRGKRKWPEQKAVIVNCGLQEAMGGTVGLETVGGFKIAASELIEAFAGRVVVKSINVHKDKIARANPWFAKIQAGRFYMVRGPWNKEFIAELQQFPHGGHDDQVDAVSVCYETVKGQQGQLMA